MKISDILKQYITEQQGLNVSINNGHIMLNGSQYQLQAKTFLKTFDITVKAFVPDQTGNYNITYVHPLTGSQETKPVKSDTVKIIQTKIGQPEIKLDSKLSLKKIK